MDHSISFILKCSYRFQLIVATNVCIAAASEPSRQQSKECIPIPATGYLDPIWSNRVHLQ